MLGGDNEIIDRPGGDKGKVPYPNIELSLVYQEGDNAGDLDKS